VEIRTAGLAQLSFSGEGKVRLSEIIVTFGLARYQGSPLVRLILARYDTS
jgi:hypothetical protein